jgi:hypothetical protein
MKLISLSLLIKRQWQEHTQLYVIGAAVLLGLLSFLFFVVHHWRDSFAGAVQNGVFLIGLFVSGGVFTSSMFQELSQPAKGIWLLGIPASHAEKVVSAILLSAFAFPLVYVGIFYLVDVLYVLFTYQQYGTAPLDLFKNSFYGFFFTYFLFNALILLGSVYFAKHSFIKTLLTIILGFVLIHYLNNFLMEAITGLKSITASTPLSGFQFNHQGDNIYVTLPPKPDAVSNLFIRIMLPVVLWGITWIRFTEKEI